MRPAVLFVGHHTFVHIAEFFISGIQYFMFDPDADFAGPSPAPKPNPTVEHLFNQFPGRSSDMAAFHQIGRAIIDGTYPPEMRLPDEGSMLKRYGVSRTALREAYGKLAGKGMILARPKLGTSVRAPFHWNMLDPEVIGWLLQSRPLDEIAESLYPLRRMIEPSAAALAAQVRTEEDLHRMEAAYAEMRLAGRDRVARIEADLRFHLEILTATHNPFIRAFSSLLHTTMKETLVLGWRGAEATSVVPARLLQHGDVLQAIRAGQADIAKMRMEILVDDAIKDVANAVEAEAKTNAVG